MLVVKAVLDGRMQTDACVGHSMRRRGASNLALGWFLLTDPIPIFNGKQEQRLERDEPPIWKEASKKEGREGRRSNKKSASSFDHTYSDVQSSLYVALVLILI